MPRLGAAQVLSVLASAPGPFLLAIGRDSTGGDEWFFVSTAIVSALSAIACWVTPAPQTRVANQEVASIAE
jgi:hypothetical protein